VRNGLEWLSEMLGRVRAGVPPVTEAGFVELEAWFRANEPRPHGSRSCRRRCCSWTAAGGCAGGTSATSCARAPRRGRAGRPRTPATGCRLGMRLC